MIGRHLAVPLLGGTAEMDSAAMLARMFMNPGPAANLLGLPMGVVVLGIGVIGLVVGLAWMWRITRGPDDGDDSWRFRR
jgi:hypothetical protein